MVDIYALQRAAHETTDENGNSVVQIPLELWQEWTREQTPQVRTQSQVDALQALVDTWYATPDDKSEEWWDEFDQFMRENRMNFPYDESMFEGLDD